MVWRREREKGERLMTKLANSTYLQFSREAAYYALFMRNFIFNCTYMSRDCMNAVRDLSNDIVILISTIN